MRLHVLGSVSIYHYHILPHPPCVQSCACLAVYLHHDHQHGIRACLSGTDLYFRSTPCSTRRSMLILICANLFCLPLPWYRPLIGDMKQSAAISFYNLPASRRHHFEEEILRHEGTRSFARENVALEIPAISTRTVFLARHDLS